MEIYEEDSSMANLETYRRTALCESDSGDHSRCDRLHGRLRILFKRT